MLLHSFRFVFPISIPSYLKDLVSRRCEIISFDFQIIADCFVFVNEPLKITWDADDPWKELIPSLGDKSQIKNLLFNNGDSERRVLSRSPKKLYWYGNVNRTKLTI